MSKKITIDGYSACGKSFVSNRIIKDFNSIHIDSGLLFRLFSHFHSINTCYKVHQLEYFEYFDKKGQFLDKEFLEYLKSEEIGLLASKIGKIEKFQRDLINLQRRTIKLIEKESNINIILLSGRNCGSIVLPNADLKFFLTAPLEIRVERRYTELISSGIKDVSKDNIMSMLSKRDKQDANRPYGKLKVPKNAKLIDTSKYSKNDVLNIVKKEITNILKI